MSLTFQRQLLPIHRITAGCQSSIAHGEDVLNGNVNRVVSLSLMLLFFGFWEIIEKPAVKLVALRLVLWINAHQWVVEL